MILCLCAGKSFAHGILSKYPIGVIIFIKSILDLIFGMIGMVGISDRKVSIFLKVYKYYRVVEFLFALVMGHGSYIYK